MPPSHIVVLGGGLTGLSSAFHLSRRFPASSITLLEKSHRLGGWVHSERVDVRDAHGNSARVLLESGPRTLRPNGKAVLELIHLLDLRSSLITVPKSVPAARNRFLHIPPAPGLTRIPTSPLALLTSPLTPTLLSGVLRDSLQVRFREDREDREDEDDDESVDAFLTARFGAEFARTFGSALVHGVYAADSRALSVRAAFPALWDAARAGGGSVVRGVVRRAVVSSFAGVGGDEKEKEEDKDKDKDKEGYEMGDVGERMRGVSVYSFRDGMATLVRALEDALGRRPNVRVVKGAGAVSLAKDAHTGAFVVTTPTGPHPASHLVSALPLPALHALLQRSPTLPTLPHLLPATPASSVTVVNLVFPPAPSGGAIHPEGFGYLVPRLREDQGVKKEEKGEEGEGEREEREAHGGVLGTVFDSCALGAQDEYPSVSSSSSSPSSPSPSSPSTSSPSPSPSSSPSWRSDRSGDRTFTKLTMMLGGPHALGHDPHPAPSHFLALLARHLGHAPNTGLPLPEPVLVRVTRQEGCIPVPGVGHLRRMAELRRELGLLEGEGGTQRGVWEGRVEVVGAGVGGVSVGDCVEAGRRVGRGW